ncbi:hypothetical protein HBI25_007980 [Parastagonospora nodorum]|nr:hypothetical protein HBH51_037100 [Parastagonospora nodorum]KAH4060968.1 hypothetical protein HBH49_008930 [Parastagonospora nodorum]KAH4073616.1 hypothetical protein HBH50_056500 [Parastagonospora nodorum]KAH4099321.1 hypothetical protein HBH48_005620 [Parastagonospora nodorum]KAH4110714.1 hypothetical protein HBH46_005150 [Parastagonospora nodorum]
MRPSMKRNKLMSHTKRSQTKQHDDCDMRLPTSGGAPPLATAHKRASDAQANLGRWLGGSTLHLNVIQTICCLPTRNPDQLSPLHHLSRLVTSVHSCSCSHVLRHRSPQAAPPHELAFRV